MTVPLIYLDEIIMLLMMLERRLPVAFPFEVFSSKGNIFDYQILLPTAATIQLFYINL